MFSDSGSYSYPIELSVSQNRELFKSIDSPHGRIRPQDLDGLPFELWYDGNMLLSGSIETDEDLDIDEDKCSINLVSGNGDFKSKIEGMQCTDVPLLDKVHLGYMIERYVLHTDWGGDLEAFLNTSHTMSFNKSNVSYAYKRGVYPFCNTRVCVKRTDEYNPELDVPYWVYEADRPWSGVCFYVAYFLDCLFKHLNMTVKEDNLGHVEDMNRLAFFTTKCEHELGDILPEDAGVSFKDYSEFTFQYRDTPVASESVYLKRVYATNKNFPDTGVVDVLESLFNAFGLKIVQDIKDNYVSMYYIRDILRDNDVIDCTFKMLSISVSYEKTMGVSLTYGGDDQDTAFNYNDWDLVDVKNNFNDIINSVAANNETCYIQSQTGNKYRIKVDKEAVKENNEKALFPSLMEVGQFTDYVLGENKDPYELKLSFTPVIENEVVLDSLKEQGKMTSQRLAVFVDAEMKAKEDKWIWLAVKHPDGHTSQAGNFRIKYNDPQAFDETQDNPLRSLDSGFTLGVMRGPGNESRTQVFLENYDGNGNSAWTTVVADYAFTADTMDAYGNKYDYNGIDPGIGSDDKNRISLKTHIQTAQDLGLKDKDGNDIDWGIDAQAAKRGLADRFMSEYMHFLLNRKAVSMDVDTTLSYLTSLSWFKQLRVNGTVGRLKSRRYTLSNSGVSDMGIELYTIN